MTALRQHVNSVLTLPLAGAVLLEVHDEWQVADRAYFSEHSMAQLGAISDDATAKEVNTDSHTALPAPRQRPATLRVTSLLPPLRGT